MTKCLPVRALAALLVLSVKGWAAEPPLDPKDLPRIPAVEATNAAQTFRIKPGFHLQLVAAEPLVVDPIAMSFDENGRLFVVEMRDYSEMREVHPHLGRIRMLEDTNGDGVFDRATVYADDLPWPTGVFCYGGGVFVAASPDIIFCKDTNGDGVAEQRKLVFTGFGAGKADKLNVQALLNSFNWGLDNRIHGQTAGNGGMVVPGNDLKAQPLELRGRDFYFDPRSFAIGAEAGGGQYGMCYDDHGRKFVCSNSHHIQTVMYDARYGERNRLYNLPAALVDIPVDGPAAEVFRLSPEEAWRVIRTKWRVAGQVSGPVEGGGRASGYFTSATGICIFRGNNWPEGNEGDAFIADVGSNLVHRKKVRPAGVELVAERPADEQKVEFLASTDLWFRPVQLVNAPDGTLYLADMYREVIEHPWSLPESIKKLLDLNSGNDRGRIWRIIPDGFKQPRLPRLGSASTAELVATLESPNGWHRDTAARLLYERQDKKAAPLLMKLMTESKSDLARMHALHALDGLGALKETQLLVALADHAAEVREHAVKLAEKFFSKGTPPAKLRSQLEQLADDASVGVRYQLAFTLGEMKPEFRIAPLTTIARRDFENSWMQAAILSSLAEGAGQLFGGLAGDEAVCNSKAGHAFLRQLVTLVGVQNKKEEVADVLEFIGKIEHQGLKFGLANALGTGLLRSGAPPKIGSEMGKIFLAAAVAVDDEKAPEETRVEAVRLLGLTTFESSGGTLLGLLNQKQPQSVQLAALSTIGRFTDAQVGIELTKRWNSMTPRVRSDAIPILLARADRVEALLRAIGAGSMRASVLDSTQQKFLRNHRDKEVKELAVKVLGQSQGSSRQEVIDAFLPALNLKGDPAQGKKIYEERCISCHRLGGEGYALGPDLVTVKTTGKEKILVNILDPNREVRPEFVSYVVDTGDDESFIGLVSNETANTLTVSQAYGKADVIPRSNIKRMQSQGQSLMPEGLEAGLTPQGLADLIGYIETAEGSK
jgi:putative membrane-bound dehydrogenase-like protein